MLGFGYYFIMVSWLKGHGLKITIQSDLKSVNLPRFHPQLDERTLLTMLTKTMSSSGHWSCFVLFYFFIFFVSTVASILQCGGVVVICLLHCIS